MMKRMWRPQILRGFGKLSRSSTRRASSTSSDGPGRMKEANRGPLRGCVHMISRLCFKERSATLTQGRFGFQEPKSNANAKLIEAWKTEGRQKHKEKKEAEKEARRTKKREAKEQKRAKDLEKQKRARGKKIMKIKQDSPDPQVSFLSTLRFTEHKLIQPFSLTLVATPSRPRTSPHREPFRCLRK